MLTTLPYRDYMLNRKGATYPREPFLRVAREADILTMRVAKVSKEGLFIYELFLLAGCLIDDLCGDPVP